MAAKITCKKILIAEAPFGESNLRPEWDRRGLWPASWVSGAGSRNDLSMAYRNEFTVTEAATIRVHVTADAVYRLFVDGELCAMGPESGDADHWFFDTYELTIVPGTHRLVALVLSFGDLPPVAKVSIRHGFLLAAEGEYGKALNTGNGNWQCLPLNGLSVVKSPYWIFGYMGGATRFDAREYPAGAVSGDGNGWITPAPLYPGANAASCNECRWPYLLRPSTLPPMVDCPISDWRILQVSAGTDIFWDPAMNLEPERLRWLSLSEGVAVSIPPHTAIRALIALPDYYCAYPYMTVSGGKDAVIALSWAESLFLENKQDGAKGDREEWRNRYFIGLADVFVASGNEGQKFFAHHWKSGRYLMLTVETAAEPLTLQALDLRETRYPLQIGSTFNTSSAQLARLASSCRRTLEMCMHDTFMDCPFYEQLMYIGDTRLQILLTYVLSIDARPAEKALRMFAAGRHHSGMLQSRYPSNVPQVIPGFSLLFIGMLHDFTMWCDNPRLVAELLPVAKGIIDAFTPYRNHDGLLENMRTWNFIDWAGNWPYGVPPGGENGVSSTLNWMWCYAVGKLSELCRYCGDAELSRYYRHQAEGMVVPLIHHFWSEKRGLFADTIYHNAYSEHAQCMALLSGVLPYSLRERLRDSLMSSHSLTPATIYFSHYLFEVCREYDLDTLLWKRLQCWFDFEKCNLKTLLERPEPSRSDCHAWSAHPLFHCYHTLLGINPAAPGFARVEIAPRPGNLSHLDGIMPHPGGGTIKVSLRQTVGEINAEVDLPEGVPGVFRHGGQEIELAAGQRNLIAIATADTPSHREKQLIR